MIYLKLMEPRTCSGGTASLDMILNLINEHGAALAAEFQPVDSRPNSRAVRLPAHGTTFPPRGCHPKLLAVVKIMEDNLEEPLVQPILRSELTVNTPIREVVQEIFGYNTNPLLSEFKISPGPLFTKTDVTANSIRALACGFVFLHFSNVTVVLLTHTTR